MTYWKYIQISLSIHLLNSNNINIHAEVKLLLKSSSSFLMFKVTGQHHCLSLASKSKCGSEYSLLELLFKPWLQHGQIPIGISLGNTAKPNIPKWTVVMEDKIHVLLKFLEHYAIVTHFVIEPIIQIVVQIILHIAKVCQN